LSILKTKSLSNYLFEDGSALLILNVHAINFQENQRYGIEPECFLDLIKEHKGLMILAGDFNSWNKKCMDKLQKVVQRLSLTAVPCEKTGKDKSFMGKEQDFVFYRELELLEAEVMDKYKLSDHNPLFVRFKRKLTKTL
jgi:endonuclease/exonuclease/phosphatase (EEP) superfamily protein YafD